MLVLDDPISKGAWFHCQHCRRSGDLIHLAAQVWNVSEESVIVKLSKLGFPVEDTDDAVQRYLARSNNIKRFQEFWEQARQNLIHGNTTVAGLVHDLKLTCGIAQERWNAGPGQMLGAAHRQQVEHTYHQRAFVGHNKSQRRVFKGSNWEDVMVLPYWQLPGKPAGFLFLGRNGNLEKDCVFRSSLSSLTPCVPRFGQEAGLMLHPQCQMVAAKYNRHVVAIGDPFLAMRMQARNFEASTRPLPLAVYQAQNPNTMHRAQTRYAWRQFIGIKPVIWMPRYDRLAIEQAIVSGARLSMVRPEDDSEEGLWRYITKLSPQDLMQRIIRYSKPWYKALTRVVAEQDSGTIEDLFYHLELDSLQPGRVLNRCDSKIREYFKGLADTKAVRRAMPVSASANVVETDDNCWSMEYPKNASNKREVLISDAVIRINDVIHHKATGHTWYRGEILQDGDSIPFCDSEANIEKNTWTWLKNLLTSEGRGLRGSPRFSKEMLPAARQFHTPNYGYGVDSVGWDARKARMLLPNYYFTSDGEVERYESLLPLPDTPAQNIAEPVPLTPAELDFTLEDPDMAGPLWACFIAAMANILSPIYRQGTCGIGLVGPGAELAGQGIAEALGCSHFKFDSKREEGKARELESRHGWPILVELGGWNCAAAFHAWSNIGGTHRHNAFAPVTWFNSQAKLLFGGWHVVRAPMPISFTSETIAAFNKLTPAYLQDVASRRFKLAHWKSGRNDPWMISVVRDIRQFVEPQLPGWLKTIDPKRWLKYETVKPDAKPLGKMLGYLVSEGKMLTGPAKNGTHPTLRLTKDGMLLTKMDLIRLLNEQKITLLNMGRVTSSLAQSDALVGVTDQGWLIERKWWEKQLAAFTAKEQQRLRIYG